MPSGPYQPPPHVPHSLSNAAWDSLACSVLSGLVKLSAAQFASEHTQRSSFVQCFAWSTKRGQMGLVCPTPCAVCLGITGAEHTRRCWYLCWYLFQRGQMCLVCPTPCAVRLGITGAEHTRPCWYLCWYLFRTVLRLVSPGNVSLARARTRTGTPCAVLRSVGTGNVPTCPCLCLCCA